MVIGVFSGEQPPQQARNACMAFALPDDRHQGGRSGPVHRGKPVQAKTSAEAWPG